MWAELAAARVANVQSARRTGSAGPHRLTCPGEGFLMQRPLCLAPIVALLVFLVFAIGAYGQEDPSSVVQRFQDARNRGDVDATMALVATDVSYVSGLACPPERPCIGTDAVRRDVQLFISDGAYSSDIGNSDVSGTIVQVQL